MTKKILRKLPSHFREGENLNIFASSIISEFEDIDTSMDELVKQIQVSTATGKFLNSIGQLFGLNRELNEKDSDFRARILSFWGIFTGSGTANDIAYAISTLLGIDIDDIEVEDIGTLIISATVNIDEEVDIDVLNLIDSTVLEAKSAGVINKGTTIGNRNEIFILNLSSADGDYIV